MALQRRARSAWARLAGVVLIFDGVLAFAAAGMFLFITLLPPIAAIEGRPPVVQSWLGQALLSVLLGVSGVWAGQRAIRGIHEGRLVGVAVAAAIAGLIGWYVVMDGGSLESILIWGGIAVAHAAVALILLAWKLPPVDRTLPASGGTRSA